MLKIQDAISLGYEVMEANQTYFLKDLDEIC